MRNKWIFFIALTAAIGLFVGHLTEASAQPQKATQKMSDWRVTLEVLNPRGEIKLPPLSVPAPRVDDLANKKIGIYWNGKAGGNNFWDLTEELLKEKFPAAKILRYKGPFDLGKTLSETLAKECDAWIYGVGD
jgi:hypothetical protein